MAKRMLEEQQERAAGRGFANYPDGPQLKEGDKSKYYNPEADEYVPKENLNKLSKNEQIETMRYWFFSNYENPVDSCPYNGREGGYLYIYGGPYEANEELQTAFGGLTSDDAINDLSAELEEICYEWSGPSNDPSFYGESDDEHFDFAGADPYELLCEELCEVGEIMLICSTSPMNERHTARLERILYSNLITLMEVYLQDAFSQKIFSNQDVLKRHVQKSGRYNDIKFPMSALFDKHDTIDLIVKEELSRHLWHDLPKTAKMYNKTLNVTFSDHSKIEEAIGKRHDFVHRNGKNTDGEEIALDKNEISNLIERIREFTAHIDEQINPVKANEDFF